MPKKGKLVYLPLPEIGDNPIGIRPHRKVEPNWHRLPAKTRQVGS